MLLWLCHKPHGQSPYRIWVAYSIEYGVPFGVYMAVLTLFSHIRLGLLGVAPCRGVAVWALPIGNNPRGVAPVINQSSMLCIED